MGRHLLSIYQPDGEPPPPEALEPVMRELEALNREMREAGVWVFAGALAPPSAATVLRDYNGEITATDGPYAEMKEHIGGFTVIEAPDPDTALEWG
ncbi:MAG TPA: YciI family protein, partial [Acidimicrobiia bacterium]|nr:YciI family protein [Acidimicrobiia bacterium]